jgi:hypothetical protein
MSEATSGSTASAGMLSARFIAEMLEEKRQFHVSLTRAMDETYLP